MLTFLVWDGTLPTQFKILPILRHYRRMQRALRALRGEQRAVPEGLRILLQAGHLLGRQEGGE